MGICIYSSFVFLINVWICAMYGYLLYSYLFAGLLTTSVIHHSMKTDLTAIVDKLAIISVVLYGGYVFFNKISDSNPFLSTMVVMTFLSTMFLYYYGYAYDKYCFAPDTREADVYHVSMHILASIGHLLIVLL
jgi:hypothetical protein